MGEVSELDACLLGALAQFDPKFCERLKVELNGYPLHASTNQTPLKDDLYDVHFGIASTLERFRSLTERNQYELLSILCMRGATSVIRLFLDNGADANGPVGTLNPLGSAASAGNVDTVLMLLDAGAYSALAFERFLRSDLSDTQYKHILNILVTNARPASSKTPFAEPLECLVTTSRALSLHPEAPRILIERGLNRHKIFGSDGTKYDYYDYYMYLAIIEKLPSLFAALLDNGANVNGRVDGFFCRSYCLQGAPFSEEFYTWRPPYCSGLSTWLTLAIYRGAVSCVDVLLHHGADINAVDGSGQSAIGLAKSIINTQHPRPAVFCQGYNSIELRYISADDDAEIFAVIKRAFDLRFQGNQFFQDYADSSDDHSIATSVQRKDLLSTFGTAVRTALLKLLTTSQVECVEHHLRIARLSIKNDWSLPFQEALVMRLLYVLSYILLLVLEIIALFKGQRSIQLPSRSLLFTGTVTILVVAWQFSPEFIS